MAIHVSTRKLTVGCPRKPRGWLEPREPGLGVDVAETLTLLPVLEQAGGSQDEYAVDTSHTEHGREDVVDENVRKASDRSCASCQQGGGGWGRTCGVGDEGGRCAVEITAAVEL